MQINFFSYGDFRDGRVVRLNLCAEWSLLLNPLLYKPRKKENFVSDTYAMFIRTDCDVCESKQDLYGNVYWLNFWITLWEILMMERTVLKVTYSGFLNIT